MLSHSIMDPKLLAACLGLAVAPLGAALKAPWPRLGGFTQRSIEASSAAAA